MALLLRQMFAQSETIMFDLHADVTQLENEYKFISCYFKLTHFKTSIEGNSTVRGFEY